MQGLRHLECRTCFLGLTTAQPERAEIYLAPLLVGVQTQTISLAVAEELPARPEEQDRLGQRLAEKAEGAEPAAVASQPETCLTREGLVVQMILYWLGLVLLEAL